MRSLHTKLIQVIFLTIILLSVLVVVISLSMMNTSAQEINASIDRELSSLSTRIDLDVSILSNLMNTLYRRLPSEFLELESGEVDNITVHSVWLGLRDSWQGTEFFSAAYLRTKWNDRLLLTHDNTRVSEEERLALSKSLANYSTPVRGFRQFNVYHIDGKAYFTYSADFRNYAYGFIIQAETLLNVMAQAKHDGEIMSIYSNGGALIARYGSEEVSANIRYTTMEHGFGNGEFVLRREIPSTHFLGKMPFYQMLLFTLALVALFSIPFTWRNIQKHILKPLGALEKGLGEIRSNNINVRIAEEATTKEFHFLFGVFNDMVCEIGSLRIESYEREMESLRMEALNLKLQVNPHMLLNSLNMIYNLAETKDNVWIQQYTSLLMGYFRYALRENTDAVPLCREMKFASDFFEMQKIRYPEMLNGSFFIEAGCEDILIPPFLIQNFVENAVKHGMVIGQCMEVVVSAVKCDDKLVIKIGDNGVGIEPGILTQIYDERQIKSENGLHIGIWNCRRRLRLFYKDEVDFEINSTPEIGTQVTIAIPGGEAYDPFNS